MFGISQIYADTASDIQGVWTLTTLEAGDTTQVWTPEESLANGAKYSYDFPLTTTDGRLRDAAILLGFKIFPPAENASTN